jgi:hypothetical protein
MEQDTVGMLASGGGGGGGDVILGDSTIHRSNQLKSQLREER